MKKLIILASILPTTIFASSPSMPHLQIQQNMNNMVLVTTIASANNRQHDKEQREQEQRYQEWKKSHVTNPQTPCDLKSNYCTNQYKEKEYFK